MRVGVVVWVEGLTLKFRIVEGVRIDRGQLLKIIDGDKKFILRVFDFKPESLLTPAEISRLSHRREHGEDVILYDKSLRLYDTALAIILCQVEEDGTVHGPTSVPALFTEVEELDKVDLQQLNLDDGDIVLGTVRSGHRATDVRITIKGDAAFPHHILVCGVTGAGKSNLGKVLAFSVLTNPEPKYSLVLFDSESEYFKGSPPDQYGLAHVPESEVRLLYVTSSVDEPGRYTVTLNFEGDVIERSILMHPLEISYSQLHPLDFILTGDFTAPQEELLWLTWKVKRDDWLNFLLESPSSLVWRVLRKMIHINTINTAKRKLKYMLGDGDIFKPEPLDTHLLQTIVGSVGRGRVVIFDTPHATEGEEKLLATVVARRIFSIYEEMKKSIPKEWSRLPYVLIMVEEAHKYLSRNPVGGSDFRENIFSIISKRGRKYKIGGLYITQMPGELIEPVIRQSLTKIILSLPTKPDYQKIIQYSPYLDEAEQEIKTLDRGEALLVSPPSGIRFAVPITIFDFNELVRYRLTEQPRQEVSMPI